MVEAQQTGGKKSQISLVSLHSKIVMLEVDKARCCKRKKGTVQKQIINN